MCVCVCACAVEAGGGGGGTGVNKDRQGNLKRARARKFTVTGMEITERSDFSVEVKNNRTVSLTAYFGPLTRVVLFVIISDY